MDRGEFLKPTAGGRQPAPLPGFVDATAAERRNVHLPARQAQPATLVASAEPRELVARAIAILAEAGEAFPLRRGVPLRGIR